MVRAGVMAVALAAGCGDEGEGKPGAIDVAYRFEGIELPDRVNLYLIDSSDAKDCDSVEGNPADLAADSKRNLPFYSESTVFEDLPADSEWVLVAVGIKDAAEVAFGCADGLAVAADRTEYTEMVLVNEPMDVSGTYTSTLEVDVGVAATLGAGISDQAFDDLVAAVCELLESCPEPDEETEQLTSDMLTVLSDLDIQASWTFAQSGDLVSGEMKWTSIEGIPVGPEWTILTGSMEGEIPGTTGMLLYSRDMAVDTEQLALFLLQNVLEQDVTEVPPEVGGVLPEMRFDDGGAVGVDSNFDRQADRLHGAFYVTLAYDALGQTDGFPFEWVAHRVESPPTAQ